MTFISTRCEIAAQGSLPVFTYKNGATHPNIISYNDRIVATPSGYSSNENAVKLFIDPSTRRLLHMLIILIYMDWRDKK